MVTERGADLVHSNGLPQHAVLPGNGPGAWNPHRTGLLGELRRRVDPSWAVLVPSDRGIESAELFRAIVGIG
jgi:hypothetical protein